MITARPIQFSQFKGIPNVEEVFERAALKASRRIEKLYAATFESWDEKPGIETKVTPRAVTVRLTGEKAFHWKLIDGGTEPRDILPRPENERQMLSFQRGWKAKTAPGSLSSGSGGKSGAFMHTPQVGGGYTAQQSIKARHWTPLIRKESKAIMHEELTKAFRIRTLLKGRS